eukprot:3939836-Rhodomonas_salina.2
MEYHWGWLGNVQVEVGRYQSRTAILKYRSALCFSSSHDGIGTVPGRQKKKTVRPPPPALNRNDPSEVCKSPYPGRFGHKAHSRPDPEDDRWMEYH